MSDIMKAIPTNISTLVTQGNLEVSPDIFYEKINGEERRAVEMIVDDVSQFMKSRTSNYLIAGVGGLLRRFDPQAAKDIDLAVVGFKYTPLEDQHSFDHVKYFTGQILNYFDIFTMKLESMGPKFSRGRIRGGSGPFALLEEEVSNEVQGRQVVGKTNIEAFNDLHLGSYGSKGFSVQFGAMRPVDVQFVFNATPEEWIARQAIMQDDYASRSGKLNLFPYTVLAKSK